jgi:hypothetical protein
VNGSRLLRKAEVHAFIEREQKARKQRLRMEADEALEGITRHARGDIRLLFKDSKLLPIDEWPDDVADCVKTVKRLPNGGFAVQFYDKLKARELMAIAGGEPKQRADHKHTFDYAAFVGAEPPADDE